jgi:hypothetical protein
LRRYWILSTFHLDFYLKSLNLSLTSFFIRCMNVIDTISNIFQKKKRFWNKHSFLMKTDWITTLVVWNRNFHLIQNKRKSVDKLWVILPFFMIVLCETEVNVYQSLRHYYFKAIEKVKFLQIFHLFERKNVS